MATSDRSHFDQYREQTQAKHTIVEKYIKVYFSIVKKSDKNLVYLDGFAGRSSYTGENGERVDGSPLRALRAIASSRDLATHVTTIFIEQDREYCDALQTAVSEFYNKNPGIREPLVVPGTFPAVVTDLLDRIGGKLAPTFVFADPCG
ncbi:MAG: three-Cys-motif partner protein TcmP, partial [Myxococcota bacterium]|nr:three-Cys-motif partner protein TcmP [Myxococcota bacterium]